MAQYSYTNQKDNTMFTDLNTRTLLRTASPDFFFVKALNGYTFCREREDRTVEQLKWFPTESDLRDYVIALYL